MKLHIKHQGETFTITVDNRRAKEVKDEFWEIIENTTRLTLELDGGGYIILGQQAVQSCVFIFEDD